MSETTTFDVVIFDKATKKISQMPVENVDYREAKRVFTLGLSPDYTKNYDLDVVPHGTFKKGDQYQ